MYNKNKSVYLDSRGHANLDSFPLRYGIHFPYSKTLDLYNIAMNENIPRYFYDKETKKCMIPVSTHFNLIVN